MTIESLIEDVVGEIKTVPGIKAIVLGGSRARGTNHPASDIDLGIYYDSHSPLNVKELSKVAEKLDDEHRADLVTEIGGWGPWINGGGWLHIQSMPVDFLYRDLNKVDDVINSCLDGTVEIFYQPGHPYGFISSIYLGEMAICKPLWDPEGIVARFKGRVLPYPTALQRALIQKFRWEMDFSIGIAQKSAAKSDVAYVAGCCFRSAMCMLQVLFALNQEHWLNEKGAVDIADNFKIKPANFRERVNEVFASLATSPESIGAPIMLLKELNTDINALLQDGD